MIKSFGQWIVVEKGIKTEYKDQDTDRWTWAFNDIYCHRTFKTAENQ